MRVYLDNCCYNRLLDDRSYSQIYYERNSVMLILELVEKSAVDLIGSEMLVREINNMDIQKNGITALKESLGVTGTLKFLEQFDHGGSGDYTKEKYEKQEAEPTYEEIRRMFGF